MRDAPFLFRLATWVLPALTSQLGSDRELITVQNNSKVTEVISYGGGLNMQADNFSHTKAISRK